MGSLKLDACPRRGVALEVKKDVGPAYFLSDLHLGAYPEGEKSSIPMLMDFLGHVESRRASLYIVGDLLDFWFEYRSVVPRRPFRLLARFKAMVENGCRVTYIAGNHDYWLGDFLRNEVGLDTCSDLVDTTIDGKRFFISHGDGIATTGDLGYRVLKGVLHSPISTAAFRMIHPDVGIGLARLFSRMSRRRSSQNHDHPDLDDFVRGRADKGYDYVVLGHLHRPKLFDVEDTTCLVVGDWIEYFTYGLFSEGKLTLNEWPARA